MLYVSFNDFSLDFVKIENFLKIYFISLRYNNIPWHLFQFQGEINFNTEMNKSCGLFWRVTIPRCGHKTLNNNIIWLYFISLTTIVRILNLRKELYHWKYKTKLKMITTFAFYIYAVYHHSTIRYDVIYRRWCYMLTTDPPSKKICWLRKKEVFFWFGVTIMLQQMEMRHEEWNICIRKKNHVKTWISIHSFLSPVPRVVLVPLGFDTNRRGVSLCLRVYSIHTYIFLLSLSRNNFEVDISLARSVQHFFIFSRIHNGRDFIFFRNLNQTKKKWKWKRE